MSPFQQAQMFTLAEPNIHNLAVEGVFDDCQDVVKAVSADLDFKRRLHIGTVNSINWARLVAQVVYYVAGWLAATDPARGGGGDDQQVSFTVPSGNFGNICAGHVARMMGLPIRRLVLATNENNVLEEFIRTGTYRVRGATDTHETSSPSMDISKASNFERFVFDLLDRDAARVAHLFGDLVPSGGFTIGAAEHTRIAEFGFVAGTSSHADRLATIAAVHAGSGRLIDTHTADGVHVARHHVEGGRIRHRAARVERVGLGVARCRARGDRLRGDAGSGRPAGTGAVEVDAVDAARIRGGHEHAERVAASGCERVVPELGVGAHRAGPVRVGARLGEGVEADEWREVVEDDGDRVGGRHVAGAVV